MASRRPQDGPKRAPRCPLGAHLPSAELSSAHISPVLTDLGRSWADLGPSWADLGPSWADLGPSWAEFGPTWPHLGPILSLSRSLGPICFASFCVEALKIHLSYLDVVSANLELRLEPSWAIFGPSWAVLAPSGASLGLPLSPRGLFWGNHGIMLGHFRLIWKASWANSCHLRATFRLALSWNSLGPLLP